MELQGHKPAWNVFESGLEQESLMNSLPMVCCKEEQRNGAGVGEGCGGNQDLFTICFFVPVEKNYSV